MSAAVIWSFRGYASILAQVFSSAGITVNRQLRTISAYYSLGGSINAVFAT
jgi:hypothetical protein